MRNPGGAFTETAPVPSEGEELGAGEEPLLKSGEKLFSTARAPLVAALEETGGVRRGARRARERRLERGGPGAALGRQPVDARADRSPQGQRRKRRFPRARDRGQLARERVAAGPALLGLAQRWRCFAATPARPGNPRAGSPSRPRRARPPGLPCRSGRPARKCRSPSPAPASRPPPRRRSSPSTDEGVWIDGERTDAHVRLTMFFKPATERRRQRRSARELVQRLRAGSLLHAHAPGRIAADRPLAQLRLGERLLRDAVRRTCHHGPAAKA